MAPPVRIPGIHGHQYLRTDKDQTDYQKYDHSYSSTSVQDSELRPLHPGLIVLPDSTDYRRAIEDITKVIEAAQGQVPQIKAAHVAIRTGGHQYSGASDAGPDDFLLDRSETFLKPEDFVLSDSTDPRSPGKRLRVSVSWDLRTFNDKMRNLQLFVPHGQCQGVRLGGHVQTGGYSQLGRSFGLFSDYVTSLEIVKPDGHFNITTVTRASDPELFYALIGGSPGNFGVITHFTIIPQEDKDYEGSYGLKAVHFYWEGTLKKFLNELVMWSDEGKMSRNWDLCISVVSQSGKPFMQNEDLNKFLKGKTDRFNGHELNDAGDIVHWFFPFIVVYLQWTRFPGDPEFGPAEEEKFAFFRSCLPFFNEEGKNSVSTMSDWWILKAEREFDHPYVKRTYLTKSQTLGQDGWVDFITYRINRAVTNFSNGLFISSQIQFFGGENSMFYKNREGGESDVGTSFSWRDSTMVATVDCFHYEAVGKRASEFARDVDTMIGSKDKLRKERGCYSDQDRRVLWGSYETIEYELDMRRLWRYYYDSEAKWKRLGVDKKKYDDKDVYSPNDFRVFASDDETQTEQAAPTTDPVAAPP